MIQSERHLEAEAHNVNILAAIMGTKQNKVSHTPTAEDNLPPPVKVHKPTEESHTPELQQKVTDEIFNTFNPDLPKFDNRSLDDLLVQQQTDFDPVEHVINNV